MARAIRTRKKMAPTRGVSKVCVNIHDSVAIHIATLVVADSDFVAIRLVHACERSESGAIATTQFCCISVASGPSFENTDEMP